MRTQALIALSLALVVGGGVLWTVFAGRSPSPTRSSATRREARSMASNLEIWRAMVRRSDEEIRLDPETQERLRALGYLGGEDAVRDDR